MYNIVPYIPPLTVDAHRNHATITDMNVFYDARYIRTDFHDGISRYSAELGMALAVEQSITFIICDLKQLDHLPKNCDYILFHGPASWREPFSALLLNKHRPDVVFSPMQTIGSFGRNYALILTLHDLIYYHHRTPPQQLAWPIRLGWRIFHWTYWPQRWLLNGADIVATVSKTSKQAIQAAKLTKQPVIVVPNAPQSLAKLLGRQPKPATNPTNLVYMGSFMPYKNVECLVKGMATLPGYTLHLLSRIKPDRQTALQALVPTGAKVIFHNGVSDTEYANLLADNALLVSASLDEGYGLPLAESLSLGVPAVVSDLAIFHEVAGDGALYFNPRSPEDFAQAVISASYPDTYRELTQQGSNHIAQFSWRQSAQILSQAIRTLTKD